MIIIKDVKYNYFVYINGTFQLQIYSIHTKRQLSKMFRITVIKQVVWDRITRLRMICATDFDTHAR